MKNIIWVVKRIFYILLCFILNIFIWRDKNIFLFGMLMNEEEKFIFNTRFLFLYLTNKEEYNGKIKPILLCDDDKIIKTFNKYGYKNVFKRNSLKGFFYTLRAKYYFTDTYKAQVTDCIGLFLKPIIINLWHGVPLKRIEYDDPLIAVNKFGQRKDIVGLIYNILVNKDDYHAVTSDYDSQKRQSSFRLKPEQCAIVGNPRLDAIYNHFKNEEIFIEKDFENIENFKKQNKKIFLYMPTFRDTKKDISGWLQSKTVHNFLQNNNIILACKLHTNDKSIVDVCCENIYKINSNSDIYSLLKYSDALITDYSSIYFDYLLLDKPIIYYPLDLEEYQTKCRGFYAPYDELTAGVKAYNEQELIKAIQDVINGIDNYKEERKVLRDKMFKYQDGRNCERVLEWIKSLDK